MLKAVSFTFESELKFPSGFYPFYVISLTGLSECFGKAHAILTNSTSEFRCRVLEALSHLFGSDVSQQFLFAE